MHNNRVFILCALRLVQGKFDAPESDQLTNGYTYCEAGLPDAKEYKALFESGKLISTIWMGRHGDRTPINYLPEGHENDAWICALEQTHVHNVSFVSSTKYFENSCNPTNSPFNYCSLNPYSNLYWPGNCSSGQLTPEGMQYQFNLGHILKKIYVDKMKLVSKDWAEAKNDVFVRATDVWRTHQSAISLMSGMFPFNYNKQFDYHHYKEYELPIYSVPSEMEYILPNPKNCPNLEKLELKVKKSKGMEVVLNKTLIDRKKFLSIVYDSNNTKRVEYSKAYDFFYFIDILQSRTCHNMKPICNLKNKQECVTKEMVDDFMIAGNNQYRILFRDNSEQFPRLAKLRMGAFLLEMKRTLLSHIANDSRLPNVIDLTHKDVVNMGQLKKIYYYSAHDTSIITLLGAFNATDMNWPPYSANIQFELWKKDRSNNELSNYYFRAFNNGKLLETSWFNGSCSIIELLNYLDKQLNLVGGFEAYLPKDKLINPYNVIEECYKDIDTTPNPSGTS